MDEFWYCPKCRYVSGDDWSQCEGKCPLALSPHHDRATADSFGRPIPYQRGGGAPPSPTAHEGFSIDPDDIPY